MDSQTHFREIIHSSGLRMTRQRKLVLDVLRDSREHLDAEALHDRVKQRDPHIGLATVYRTLALLKAHGMVRESRLGEEHGHFETQIGAPHYHFTCVKCMRVIEFEAPFLLKAISSLAEREELQVTAIDLSLSGYCPDCSEND
jgi:Fe2+ or Zn2+ uptake regulation protein